VFLADPGHTHVQQGCNVGLGECGSGSFSAAELAGSAAVNTRAASNTQSSTTGVTVNDGAGHNNATAINGSGTPHNNMQPFMLGSCFLKL
jgi:hypothetical protein